jgi:transcriptional regulator with XRE-family HTH domain
MTFSEKLLRLRIAKGLTQEELGEILGVNQSQVWRWEDGADVPTEMAAWIAERLGVNVLELIGDPKRTTKKKSAMEYVSEPRVKKRGKTKKDPVP